MPEIIRGDPVKSSTPLPKADNTQSVSQSGLRPLVNRTTAAFKQAVPIPKTKKGKFDWAKLRPSSKKQWVIGGVVVAVLLATAVFGGWWLYKRVSRPAKLNETPAGKTVYVPPKTTEPSRLTGVEVAPELNKRPVTGVMIENSPDARPQSGLKDGGIVFEAIAEGGITRFLALYQEAQPGNIGPVRSVRPYYLDFLMPFDAAIAHAGGSGQGLADIAALGVKDLSHNSSAFHRVSSRFAPHNLYTGFPALDDYSKSKGYTSSTFTSWKRKAEKAVTPPTAVTIDLNISSFNYNVHYDYDAATNSYKRSEGGKTHVDADSGAQLTPKVVIALVVVRTQSGIYSVYQTTGSGTMLVFQDGTVTKSTWSKAGRKEPYVFKDEAGQPLGLNPGQTWVTLITSDSAATYKP